MMFPRSLEGGEASLLVSNFKSEHDIYMVKQIKSHHKLVRLV